MEDARPEFVRFLKISVFDGVLKGMRESMDFASSHSQCVRSHSIFIAHHVFDVQFRKCFVRARSQHPSEILLFVHCENDHGTVYKCY